VTGTELLGMGDDNIYTILDNLYNALMNDASAEELSPYIDQIKSRQSDVLSVAAQIGGRVNRLELIANRYEEDSLMYTDMKSKLEDVDQAEAVMNFKMAEYVYTAALQIGSKIIQPSLVDFLS
jgi:flagellar hook-associated protein 3 FlgL